MRRTWFGPSVLLITGLLGFTACSDPRGGTADQAVLEQPLGYTPPSTGALTDYTNYQPAQYDPVTSVGAASTPDAAAPVEPEAGAEALTAEVQEHVRKLAGWLTRGELLPLKEACPAAQVALLTDDALGRIKPSFEKYATLRGALESRFDAVTATEADRRWTGLPEGGGAVTIVDAATATVAPNPLQVLLGPGQVGASLTLIRTDAGWGVDLNAPLETGALDAILQYHTALQAALDQTTDGVESGALDAPAALDAIGAAVAATAAREASPTPEPGASAP